MYLLSIREFYRYTMHHTVWNNSSFFELAAYLQMQRKLLSLSFKQFRAKDRLLKYKEEEEDSRASFIAFHKAETVLRRSERVEWAAIRLREWTP